MNVIKDCDEMNLPMILEKCKNTLDKKILPFYRKILANRKLVYSTFIILTSLFCIMLAELSPNGRMRMWYYDLTHKEIIDKGIQYKGEEGIAGGISGQFLTYYRFREFGGSNPSEIDPNAPMVAITFDDGPNPSNTQRILDTLNANYSHATFFVVGTNAEKYQDTLKSISVSGSEIGNHSYAHKNLTTLSESEVEEEIDAVNRVVKKATGENATVIRPPYGAFDDDLLNQLKEPIILWDLDTEDWDSRNAQVIVDKVLSEVNDGDIILMHDIYESTAEAVEILIPKLKEAGYQVVTVSEMARYKGKELELGKPYGEIRGVTQ